MTESRTKTRGERKKRKQTKRRILTRLKKKTIESRKEEANKDKSEDTVQGEAGKKDVKAEGMVRTAKKKESLFLELQKTANEEAIEKSKIKLDKPQGELKQMLRVTCT